jgi:hypothetical protein
MIGLLARTQRFESCLFFPPGRFYGVVVRAVVNTEKTWENFNAYLKEPV